MDNNSSKGLVMTKSEYKQLQEYLSIVANKTNAAGIRRLAMNQFNKMVQKIRKGM